MNKVHVNVARAEDEISTAFEIREKVYIDEQQIDRADEFDEHEDISRHFVAYAGGSPCGAARWRFTSDGAKLERFAVLPEFRRKGIGAALVAAVIDDIRSRPEYKGQLLYLNAQESAMPLYAKFDFTPVGKPFMECDIKHYRMELP